MSKPDKNRDELLIEIQKLRDENVALKASLQKSILREQEESSRQQDSIMFMNNVIEQSPNAFWITDLDGTLIRMNQACRDILHLKEEEVVGIYNLLNDNLLLEQGFMPQISEVFTKGISTHFVTRYNTGLVAGIIPEQTVEKKLDIHISPVFDRTGNSTHAVVRLTDISELERTVDSLRRSEERLLEVLNNSLVTSYKRNLKTNTYEYLSPVIYQISGYTAGEMMSFSIEKVLSLLHPDDQPEIGIILSEALSGETKTAIQIEFRFLHKEGRYIWIHDQFIIMHDENGKPMATIGSFSDITGRKQAEEELRQSAARLNEAQEMGNLGSFSYDVLLNESKTSPHLNKIFGFSPDQENPVRTWVEILHPDDRERMESAVKQCIEAGLPFQADYRILRPTDGMTRWLHVIARAEKDSYGKVIRFSGVNIDITDRKEAEEELAQTRHNYQSFFNTIDEYLTVLDEQGNILHSNTTVNERLGYEAEELLGKSVLIMHPVERQAEAGRIVGEMLQGITEYCPVPLITKSGIQIPVETRVTPGTWDGKPAIFGVTKDISKLRLSEEKFSKIFHANPSACGLSNLSDHTYTEVNEAFYTLFGFTKNEVIGNTAIGLGILTAESTLAVMSQADNNGNVSNVEADLKTKDGSILHVLLSSENIFIQNNKYRFTFVQDVTERKKAEEALKTGESQARALLDAIPDLMFRLNSKGVFLDYKAASEDLVYQAESIIGKNNRDLVPADFADLIDDKIASTLRTGEMQVFEYSLRLPQGKKNDYEARMVPYGRDEVIAIAKEHHGPQTIR